ncbi:MAG: hypothetical protein K6G50_13910 [bacterium]|nr:hypothetical protein [bacterium]
MEELCFASFAKCLQKFLKPPNTDQAVVELLLKWIVSLPNVYNKNKQPVDISQQFASDLINRKINIPASIKAPCSEQCIYQKAVEHCELKILPSLIPFIKYDLFEALLKLIDKDTKISRKLKKEFKCLDAANNEAGFLAKLLIYVINRENRPSDPIAFYEMPLLEEACFKCPLCGMPLLGSVKKPSVKRYAIVSIYNNKIAALEKKQSLSTKPNIIDAPANMLVLCKNHADEYNIEPTLEEYNKLKEIKRKLAKSYSLRCDIYNYPLEEEIKGVLNGLAGINSETELEELTLEALAIDKKILPNNYLLLNDETSLVLRYYNFIKEMFASLDRDNSLSFEVIASQIKAASRKLEDKKMPQEDIVELLADWIKGKTGKASILACRTVVAFFIQNCEVFREISE